jgi:hypothetical protein
LIGMSLPWGKIAIGGLIAIGSFAGAVWAMSAFQPAPGDRKPALVAVPPLPVAARTSTVVTPVVIALTAIRDSLERTAPRDLAGKRDNPLSQLLSNGEISWSVARGPLGVTGKPDGLAVATALTGTLRATGQLSSQASNLTGAIGNLLGGSLGQSVQNLGEKPFDQRTDFRGNVTVTSRPALLPGWRVDPNLAAQVALANEVKPLLDRNVNEQVAALQARVRDDPFVELAARREWAKMCRSISLGASAAGMPNLWLEMRPTRAFAAQPRISEQAVTLTVGVQADTRIVPSETKPDCPFPEQLELVPQMDQGKVNIAVPIDIPFTEVNRLLEAQLKGKSFPEDAAGAFSATVRGVTVAASGDRLLISLRVKANENKSWLGVGAEATIHVWGRPVLDGERQMLRLADIALDVESQAAFGLLGAAARAAVPYLEKTLADNAVVDLLPLAANARKSIEASLSAFRKNADGVRVDAAITNLRLVGIEFDAKTLRVIAEADGTVKVAVTALP